MTTPSTDPETLPATQPYDQGGYRTLTPVWMPQGHWIVWNWNTASWDRKTQEEMRSLRAHLNGEKS